MLRELKVEQLALIESLSMRFEPGFNVLTGETGAGKSMVVDAVGLAIGGRARADLVREGASESVVEALFEPSSEPRKQALDEALAECGLPVEGGVMVVRRVMGAAGRHRAYVNGSLATVTTLSRIASGMVAVCGQHEHVALTRPGEALALLDSFAAASVPEFENVRAAYSEAWRALEKARESFWSLRVDPASRAEREDFLRFQLSELESLSPRPGELEELYERQRRLAGADRLVEISSSAESMLYSSDGAVSDVLARAKRLLEEGADVDSRLGKMLEPLEEALALVSDLGRELGSYARSVDADPVLLEQVESRISALRRLARRYGGDIDAACSAGDALRQELDDLERYEVRLGDARRRLDEAENAALTAASELSRLRMRAAARLDEDVREGLERLGMAGSRVALRVNPRELGDQSKEAASDTAAMALCPTGSDRVEVGLASEPGAPLRPISRIASGGELARLLLAFRRAVSSVDGTATVILDEVDAGIGGAVAEAAGVLISELAKGRQVLCVTHLPQLAVHARHHLMVRKETVRKRVVIRANALSGREREDEVARMLGGAEITGSTMAHARDLLQMADSSGRAEGSEAG